MSVTAYLEVVARNIAARTDDQGVFLGHMNRAIHRLRLEQVQLPSGLTAWLLVLWIRLKK